MTMENPIYEYLSARGDLATAEALLAELQQDLRSQAGQLRL